MKKEHKSFKTLTNLTKVHSIFKIIDKLATLTFARTVGNTAQ